MMSGQANQVIRRMRAVLAQTEGEQRTDGHLLEGYLAQRDEFAFAALVRRFGPMVLGVCRRVLGNAHDAEDAFQATFIVLVRKAASVRPRERVGNWLYGVAYRTALEARTSAARRRTKERKMSRSEAAAEDVWQDVRPVLDQELNALPEVYRLAVVLCDLEGKTRKEVARQLGWPEGTVAGRLVRARALLARRLARRGIGLSAAALVALLPSGASAAVPASLVAVTSRTATLIAAGQAAAPGAISAKVAALSEGVLKAMLFAKLRAALTVAMVLGFLGLIGGLGAYRSLAGDSAGDEAGDPPPPTQKVAPPAKPAPSAGRPIAEVDDGFQDAFAADRLPDGQPPTQALVSLAKDGELIVRTGSTFYEPVTARLADGRVVTSYRRVSQVRTEHFNRGEFKVRDTHGKPVGAKQLPNLMKGEIVALIHRSQAEIDLLHLRLIKDGTLVFLLPPRTTSAVPSVVEVAPPAAPLQPPLVALPQLPNDPSVPLPPQDTATGKAQPARANELIVSATRQLQIAMDVKHKDMDAAAAVRLFMSADQGAHWEQIAAASPGTKALTYNAPADGIYWFAAEFVSASGTTRRLPPHLKVLVQTAMPPQTPATPLPAIKVHGHDDSIVINERNLDIRLMVKPAQRQSIAKLRLWVSTDSGKTWKPAAQVSPDVAAFSYTAASDGMHWFAIQVVPRDGAADPADIGKLTPQLKVIVHTQPPGQ